MVLGLRAQQRMREEAEDAEPVGDAHDDQTVRRERAAVARRVERAAAAHAAAVDPHQDRTARAGPPLPVHTLR